MARPMPPAPPVRKTRTRVSAVLFYYQPVLVFQNEWLFSTQPKALLQLVLLTVPFLSQYIKSKEKKYLKNKITRFSTSQKEHLY